MRGWRAVVEHRPPMAPDDRWKLAMTETETTHTTPHKQLDIVDDLQAGRRTLFGGVNALRHMAHSPDEVQDEELAMLADVLDGAFYKLSEACDDIEAVRVTSKAEVAALKARIAVLEEQHMTTPAGQMDSLKAWANVIRATCSTALKSLDEKGAVA